MPAITAKPARTSARAAATRAITAKPARHAPQLLGSVTIGLCWPCSSTGAVREQRGYLGPEGGEARVHAGVAAAHVHSRDGPGPVQPAHRSLGLPANAPHTRAPARAGLA